MLAGAYLITLLSLMQEIFTNDLIRLPINGNILTGYKLTLHIGSPPIAVPDIMIDTGSSLLVIPCQNCINCNG